MKIAVVSGANKGIGLETSRQLAQRGFHVVMGSRDKERGIQAAELLQSESLSAEYAALNMQAPEDFKQLHDTMATRFGHVDVLINNAAVQIETENWNVNTTSTISMKVLRETFDINFFGLIELTQVLLPLIRKSPAGRIVNLSSILASLAMHAQPGSNTYNTKTFAYNSSKAAVNAFTIHLAHELRDTSIKVNSAHPGWVKTDMGGSDASMELAEGARCAVQLATLGPDGPNGAFVFGDKELPW